ncbi:MAG: hypothetical protein R2724_00845 [Bryobacterales bacterium]
MQEFKVATNNGSEFEPLDGRRTFSMVLKSGTNELHGTVYEYLRNSAFDANEFFANRKWHFRRRPFRLNQYGVAVGGPIRRYRTRCSGS